MTTDFEEYFNVAEERISQQGRMLTALREALKETREHLIKVRDASPETGRLETNKVISRAWHALNFDGRPESEEITRLATIEECARVAERRALRYSSPGGYQRANESHEIAKDIRALKCSPIPSQHPRALEE